MTRLISAIYVLGTLAINLLFQGDVSLTMDVAPRINAGSELLVKVSLNKKNISGFCRFQQELPAGFTATAVSTSNADFTFKDQKVRFIWLKLPGEEQIEISYKITCDERLKGSINLAGKFSYIEENQRKSVDVEPRSLAIVPNPNIDAALLVDVKDYGRQMPAGIAETSFGRIACVRQTPQWIEGQNEYIVNLLVNKEKIQKFAKIEEIVPQGFTALNVNSRDGIFTFKDGKAKFLWMSLPADNYFIVSYKLVPVSGVDPNSVAMSINGTFSYIIDDKTQSINVWENEADLKNLTAQEIAVLLNSDAKTQYASTTKAKANAKNKTLASNSLTTAKAPVDTPRSVKSKLEKNVDIASVHQKNTRNNAEAENETFTLDSNGIYFRVQIAAGHKPINIRSYFGKYKLEKSIAKEDHNGWIKYSVGSFAAYKEARDYRVHLWNTTPITDAFVSAYNEGKRITIQEALMETNQKWIK